MAVLSPHYRAGGLEEGNSAALGSQQQHAERIRRASAAGGYLHQSMHLASGLNDRVARSVPRGTGLYLVGEGHIVHDFDPVTLEERGVSVVAVDRDLPERPQPGVDAQIRCDLHDIAEHVRSGVADLDFEGATAELPRPGTFMASHIGRYLPDADTAVLLEAALHALPPDGNIWLIDTPLAARLRKLSGSPGFLEAYRLAETRRGVRIAVDEVIAPVIDLGFYYQLERMRARRPGSDDEAFFDAVEQGKVRFDAVPSSRAREDEYRVGTGRRSVRVNGWGIRAMMLEKR